MAHRASAQEKRTVLYSPDTEPAQPEAKQLCLNCKGNGGDEVIYAAHNGILCNICIQDANTFGWFYKLLKGRINLGDVTPEIRENITSGFYDRAMQEVDAQFTQFVREKQATQFFSFIPENLRPGKAYTAAKRIVSRHIREFKATLHIS